MQDRRCGRTPAWRPGAARRRARAGAFLRRPRAGRMCPSRTRRSPTRVGRPVPGPAGARPTARRSGRTAGPPSTTTVRRRIRSVMLHAGRRPVASAPRRGSPDDGCSPARPGSCPARRVAYAWSQRCGDGGRAMDWLLYVMLFVTIISLAGIAFAWSEQRRSHRLEMQREERLLIEAKTKQLEAENRRAELEYRSALAELARFDPRAEVGTADAARPGTTCRAPGGPPDPARGRRPRARP